MSPPLDGVGHLLGRACKLRESLFPMRNTAGKRRGDTTFLTRTTGKVAAAFFGLEAPVRPTQGWSGLDIGMSVAP